jgi:3-deoxy-D-manno-octulosonate cytidylyltransferase
MTPPSLFSQILTVIPARYGSSRFPGKPLALLQGLPMVQHTWQRVKDAGLTGPIVVATDDERIAQACAGFGGQVALTNPNHPSGTDRVWEVAQQHPDSPYVLNVQGDEPFINPAHLRQAVEAIALYPTADLITLVCPIHRSELSEALANPNHVKAVRAQSGQALYFSRAGVPFCRDGWENEPADVPVPAYRHIGLYIYKRTALERLTQLPMSPLESIEKLEQLRALEHGLTIYAAVVDKAPVGVDTPADLEALQTHAVPQALAFASV